MNQQLNLASQFRKNQEYSEAIQLYVQLWQQNANQFNEWDGWSFAYCYSKLNQHAEALEICRQLYPRFKTSEILKSLYAKCIYYTQFNKAPSPSLDILKKATTAIVDLAPPQNPYSFAPRAIFNLIKVLMNQQQIDWAEIEKWLLKMDPDLLDNKPFQMTDARGKKIEMASPLEEWYAQMIKTKAGLNQPQQLLDILEEARKKKIKWHYNNDIWFQRKEAFAWHQLGENKKAENMLRQILTRKQDWFLIFDLASIVPDKDEALRLLCKAALSSGKNEMKLKLFEALFQHLKEIEKYKREAGLHLCLIIALREENNWPVKPELITALKERNINAAQEGSSIKIIHSLTPFWKKIAGEEISKRMHGIISKLLPGDTSGFIRCRNQTYFASFKGMKEKPKEKIEVSFELIDSFDKKKNAPSKMAVKIKFL